MTSQQSALRGVDDWFADDFGEIKDLLPAAVSYVQSGQLSSTKRMRCGQVSEARNNRSQDKTQSAPINILRGPLSGCRSRAPGPTMLAPKMDVMTVSCGGDETVPSVTGPSGPWNCLAGFYVKDDTGGYARYPCPVEHTLRRRHWTANSQCPVPPPQLSDMALVWINAALEDHTAAQLWQAIIEAKPHLESNREILPFMTSMEQHFYLATKAVRAPATQGFDNLPLNPTTSDAKGPLPTADPNVDFTATFPPVLPVTAHIPQRNQDELQPHKGMWRAG